MALRVSDLAWIDATGYHYADYPTFLTFVQQGYSGIYGSDVYLGPDSMDGQWTAVLAQAFYDTAALGGATYNSFSPVTAQGVGLSRVVKINGVNRQVPTFSSVPLTIVGVAGTVILNGIAIDTLNQQWALPASVTIPGPGTITVTAIAVAVGAINAAINTVTGIFTPTTGWQSVNNAVAATPGAPVESDAQLRARQKVSVANPSLTVLEGTLGAVLNVTGVTAAKSYENPTGTTDANGLPPHSFSIVAAGGDSTAIAQAIADHKTPGTETYGTTTVTVYDNHGMPIAISFIIPTPATIGVRVTLAPGMGWSTDFEAPIAAAIASAVTTGGQNNPYPSDGGIGDTVYLTPLFLAAYLPGPQGQTYVISTIELKKNSGSFASANVSLDFDEIPVCSATPGVNVVFVT